MDVGARSEGASPFGATGIDALLVTALPNVT